MTSTRQKRIACFDVIKTWSIFYVLVIHMAEVMPFFPRTWWSAAFTIFTVSSVPLFLMVNGALLLNRPLDSKKWKHRLISLIVLTFFWKLVGLSFCYFFWDFNDITLTPRIVIEYLFGGDTPYWQLKYLWFLNMYTGLYAFLPLWKHLFDFENGKYLKLGFVITLVCTFGSPTISMLLQPLDTLLGTKGLSTVLAHLSVFVPMSENAVYVVYFFAGGLLYRSFAGADSAPSPTKNRVRELIQGRGSSILLLGAVSYVAIFFLNRYQAVALENHFSVTPNYTNAFTLFLSSALFLFFLSLSYPSKLTAICETVGRRTFGVYILHIYLLFVVQITVGDHSITSIIPNGSHLPPLLAMFYLLAIILLCLFVTTGAVAVIERIPLANRLLPQ